MYATAVCLTAAFVTAPIVQAEPTAKAVTVTNEDTVDSYKVAVDAINQRIAEAKASLTTRLDDVIAGGVTTATLTQLKADAIVKIEALNSEYFLGTNLYPIDFVKFVKNLNEAADAKIAEVEAPVVAWETELVAEKERIRIAEEARKAEQARKAAEAAQQAANAARRSSPRSGPVKATTPVAGESQQGRLSRIIASLPFSVPSVVVGTCPGVTNALGCYGYNSVLVLTQRVLGRSDCSIVSVIAHESRHYQQHMNGQIQFSADGTEVLNRDWLESDATSFASSYGC